MTTNNKPLVGDEIKAKFLSFNTEEEYVEFTGKVSRWIDASTFEAIGHRNGVDGRAVIDVKPDGSFSGALFHRTRAAV